jgi:hypothetical protein
LVCGFWTITKQHQEKIIIHSKGFSNSIPNFRFWAQLLDHKQWKVKFKSFGLISSSLTVKKKIEYDHCSTTKSRKVIFINFQVEHNCWTTNSWKVKLKNVQNEHTVQLLNLTFHCLWSRSCAQNRKFGILLENPWNYVLIIRIF